MGDSAIPSIGIDMQQNFLNVRNTYGAGIQDRQSEQINALRMDQAKQSITQNKASFDQGQAALSEEQRRENTAWLANSSKYVIDNPQALRGFIEEGKKRKLFAPDFDKSADPQELLSTLPQLHQSAMAALGQPRLQDETLNGVSGQRDPLTNEFSQLGGATQAKPPASISEYRLYSDQQQAMGKEPVSFLEFQKEIAAAGSTGRAEGAASVVPVGDRIDSAKQAPRIKAARSNLSGAREVSDRIAKRAVGKGGPLQGEALGLTEDGQLFTQYIDNLMTHIQALTRIPGVGAQSDWEGRLNKAVLPDLSQRPSARQVALDELELLVSDLEEAASMVSSGNLTSQPQSAQSQSGPPRITTDQEYDALPSGSVFIDPEGNQRRKP